MPERMDQNIFVPMTGREQMGIHEEFRASVARLLFRGTTTTSYQNRIVSDYEIAITNADGL